MEGQPAARRYRTSSYHARSLYLFRWWHWSVGCRLVEGAIVIAEKVRRIREILLVCGLLEPSPMAAPPELTRPYEPRRKILLACRLRIAAFEVTVQSGAKLSPVRS
jgi:hypothetical protein